MSKITGTAIQNNLPTMLSLLFPRSPYSGSMISRIIFRQQN
jgi:hypothetical protein